MSEYKKTALVLGAGGFIGSQMVKRLRSEGYWVRGVDIKHTEFSKTEANEFISADLRDADMVRRAIRFTGYLGNFYNQIAEKFVQPFDEIYQFAADMGGAGFVFTGENDADILHNSVQINLNVLEEQRKLNESVKENKTKIFYSGSACMYPEHNQLDPDNPDCREESAYPANPDSEYGWEKLFSERLFLLTIVIMGFLFVLLGITISSVLREPMKEEERKLQLQSAARSLSSRSRVELSRCGEMVYKLVPSCSLMNASKRLGD